MNKIYSYLIFNPYLLMSNSKDRAIINSVTVTIDVKIAGKDIIIGYFSRLSN